MPRKVVAHEPPLSNGRICCFCGLAEDNELQYGKIHEYDGIVTHYYCLLLSSNMQQKGRDDEGILGFLSEDINKELKRGKRLACCYCKKTGATLGCCNTKCKKIFHFPCGLKAGSLHQFFGEFRSYCKNHRPKQKIDERVSEEVKKRDDMICYICYDDVSPHDMYDTLWAPCCKKNAWFHRTCVQQLAMSAGYFFKCPLCNNKAEFQRAMLDHGIFIPSQDASWELVPNAFQELLYRHNRCDADVCLCPKGRDHTSTNAKWELTLCRTCGSQGIHMACGQLKWVKPVWECSECTSILNKTLTSDSESSSVVRESRQRRRLQGNATDSIDEESSDSEISVGTDAAEASTSESSSVKNHHDETEKSLEEPVALRITRRSVIPIPKSPVNTKTSKTARMHEDLPPDPKRPRLSEEIVERCRRESIDSSDDDIIVISGPSKSDSPVSNVQRCPIEKVVNKFQSIDPNAYIEDPGQKDEPQELKKSETSANLPCKASHQLQPGLASRVPTEPQARVVEIDLSESECSIPETRGTNPIVNENPTVSPAVNPPELNIMITNVTSLAPEAFESVEEPKVEPQNDLTKVLPRTSIYNESNGGLTSQTPIVIDDDPLPVAPTNRPPDNNNLRFSPTDIHDQMKVVRFDSPRDAAGNPTNTVVYGITIPGTNQTLPVIFTAAENGTSTDANNTTPISFDINAWLESQRNSSPGVNVRIIPSPYINADANAAKTPELRQIGPATTTKTTPNVETPIAPKANESSLSLSVPLKSIVNERFSTSRTSRKSSEKNSNKSVISSLNKLGIPITSKNSVATGRPSSTAQKGSFVRTPAGPPLAKTHVSRPKTPVSNGFGPSTTPRQPTPNSPSNDELSIGIDAATITKMFALLPPECCSPSPSPLPNGIVSSTTPPTCSSVPNSNKPATTNLNGNITNANTTWSNAHGCFTQINNDPTKAGVTPANLSPSMQLQIQKSVDNERQIAEPQLFQLIRADQNNYSTSDDCDGDAGSGPAVQPATVNNPANTKPSHTRQATASPHERVSTPDVGTQRTDGRTSDAECDADTDDEAERSTSPDRGDASYRAGLIYKSINLRDLKFSVCGSSIVKMTLYDTYTVDIKVDSSGPCKSSKFSSARRTTKSSMGREDKAPDIERCDSEDVPSSLNPVPSIDNDAALNQPESSLEDDVPAPETVNQTNDVPSIDVVSRSQEDEVKENLDPVPPSTNSTHNATADRKSKLRQRSGVNHSMRSLNEKEAHKTICEKMATPKKVTPHESETVQNQSIVLYNGWKETACQEEPSAPNALLDRSVETTPKSWTPRSSVNDNITTEDFDVIHASKRKRISASANHLVKDADNSKRKWSSSDDISQSRKFHVNSIIDGRKMGASIERLSCKVSIDLARIRAILATKLNIVYKIPGSNNERRSATPAANRPSGEDVFRSKSLTKSLTKSRSLDNLTHDSRKDSTAELRKWKSFEDLSRLSFSSTEDNIVENRMRGCKRKRRSFEKHDCVR